MRIHRAFLAVPVLCGLPALGQEAPTEGPAFSADPAQLLAFAKAQALTEGQGALELLEETLITFDAEGKRETRYRYLFRLDHESALSGWNTVSAVWKPWNQARPRIRARVITPNGAVHALDPATIGEVPVREGGPDLFDDRKKLVAPLPQLCVGAVAEVELVLAETQPFFASGSLLSVNLQQPVPVLHTRVEISAPPSMPLRWKFLGLPGGQLRRRLENGAVRWSTEMGRMEPPEEMESHGPWEEQPRPTLLLSTAPSWSAVASGYAKVVAQQLEGARLDEWVRDAVGDASDPKAKIDRILARLGREIRYTGLEFGEGSLVPRSPGETLKRGYGDCKDKATLLVGLLNASGIPAQVALLATGPGQDMDAEMPGLNHFDHAIVYVPGPTPLWIDATADKARAGDLPFADQGRRALIASGDTKGLVVTPRRESADNLSVETREIFLADRGRGRIVETSHPTGLAEMALRNEMDGTSPKTLRENLKKYVQNVYGAKDLGKFEMVDPSDLGRAFTLKLEALDCTVAQTYDLDATVSINLWAMSEKVRRLIPLPADGEGKQAPPIRKKDLVFPEPYAVEWRYRIVPAPGFAPKALPANETTPFGPASLVQSYEREKDGAVKATFRFESGKRRWTPSEVESARKALKAFGDKPPISLGFDQVGEAQLAAGKIQEALQTFRREAAEAPMKAAPLSRLAMALLKGGMGEQAREVARKACALEPASMFAQRALGFVLIHDLVDRPFAKGWDPQGAIEAMTKAKGLDPEDALTRKNLAIALEYAPDGTRYGPGSRLDLAIEEIRALRKDLKVEDLTVNLLIDLARLGRLKELEETTRDLPPSPTRSAWMLAALAASRGSKEALAEAPRLVPEAAQRRSALLSAGEILVSPLRKYAEASAFLLEGAAGSDQAPSLRNRAAMLAQVRRHEEVPIDPKSPITPVWGMFRAALGAEVSAEAFAELFTPELRATVEGGDMEALKKTMRRELRALGSQGVPTAVTLDVLMALSQVSLDGSEARGFKIRLQTPGNGDSEHQVFGVSKVKHGYRIVAIGEALSSFGTEALRRLALGDATGARGFLDWARDLAWAGSADDPYSGHAFCRFWTKGREAAPDEIRWAAAALQAPDKDCAGAIPILLEGRKQVTDPARRLPFDLALAAAYMARREGPSLEPIARSLVAQQPGSKMAIRSLSFALWHCRKWEEALKFADDQLKKDPDNADLLRSKADVLEAMGRTAERTVLLQSMIDRGQASASEFNNLAWDHLLLGSVSERSVELARRALLIQPNSHVATHTLASLLAERGEPAAALEMLAKLMKDEDLEEPRGEEWYVFGRIAEQFGEKEAALASYRRVAPPKEAELAATSCHALAQRRVKTLGLP